VLSAWNRRLGPPARFFDFRFEWLKLEPGTVNKFPINGAFFLDFVARAKTCVSQAPTAQQRLRYRKFRAEPKR